MSEFGIDVMRGEAGVAWLVVRNPARLNAVRLEMWQAIPETLAGLASDPAVVAKAKDFVMIRLDKDQNTELSGKYAPDGQYIPRTFFLTPAGELEADVHAPRDQYKYFYDESDPKSVLAGMDAALAKAK